MDATSTKPWMILGLLLLLVGFDWFGRLGMLPGFLPTCNPGVALGILLPSFVLWLGTVAALSIGFFGFLTATVAPVRLAWLGLLLGGGSNVIDRTLSGCVHDYLRLSFFPSFNLADTILFLGVGFLFWHFLSHTSQPAPYVR